MKGKNTTWEEAVLLLREQPDKIDLVRACFFDDPLIASAKRYYKSSEWRGMRQLLPEQPGIVLDLGAGRGVTSYAFARDYWTVVAMEPSSSAIVGAGAIRNLAIEAQLPIQVGQGIGEHLPFADETFDLVFGRQVLHHARDLQELCKEVARVLKDGGIFIATREHVISKKEHLSSFLESHPLHRFYGGENAYLLKEYINAINQAGISITQILNPYESEINLFPNTKFNLKRQIAERMIFVPPKLIPNFFISLLGRIDSTPGRLYSFVGRKVNV